MAKASRCHIFFFSPLPSIFFPSMLFFFCPLDTQRSYMLRLTSPSNEAQLAGASSLTDLIIIELINNYQYKEIIGLRQSSEKKQPVHAPKQSRVPTPRIRRENPQSLETSWIRGHPNITSNPSNLLHITKQKQNFHMKHNSLSYWLSPRARRVLRTKLIRAIAGLAGKRIWQGKESGDLRVAA